MLALLYGSLRQHFINSWFVHKFIVSNKPKRLGHTTDKAKWNDSELVEVQANLSPLWSQVLLLVLSCKGSFLQ